MVISSLIVEVYPDQVERVKAELVTYPGTEVHDVVDGQKIIVSLEADTVDDSYDISTKFSLIEGVFGVSLAYCDFAEDETIYPDGI